MIIFLILKYTLSLLILPLRFSFDCIFFYNFTFKLCVSIYKGIFLQSFFFCSKWLSLLFNWNVLNYLYLMSLFIWLDLNLSFHCFPIVPHVLCSFLLLPFLLLRVIDYFLLITFYLPCWIIPPCFFFF